MLAMLRPAVTSAKSFAHNLLPMGRTHFIAAIKPDKSV